MFNLLTDNSIIISNLDILFRELTLYCLNITTLTIEPCLLIPENQPRSTHGILYLLDRHNGVQTDAARHVADAGRLF